MNKAIEISELIARVEALTEPDREVDADLEVTFVRHGWVTSKKDPGAVAETAQYFWPEGKLRYITKSSRVAPLYTSSVDAALAFKARVLPGWRYDIHSPRFGQQFEGVLMDGDSASRRIVVAEHATEPLAIILATLKAKAAE